MRKLFVGKVSVTACLKITICRGLITIYYKPHIIALGDLYRMIVQAVKEMKQKPPNWRWKYSTEQNKMHL
ncbi:hypothetical protein A8C23_19200 [Klebsiella pneumoniae]|nr:hypothetical protein A8C23_19200 [Klebsiella pneumoniae]KSZ26071.1 hypothetical protein APU21_14640 [Klebsiella pneumoniae]